MRSNATAGGVCSNPPIDVILRLTIEKRAHLLLVVLSFAFLVPPHASGDELKILSRNEWKARSAKETGIIETHVEAALVARGPSRYLTVHHTGVPATGAPLAVKMRKHQALMFQYSIIGEERGHTATKHIFLRDTPYHFYIDGAGRVAEGRELRFAAFSNTTYLTPIEQHITVALEGDFNTARPTGAQMRSLVELLQILAKRYAIKLANIGYHQSVVAQRVRPDGSVEYGTACPGKNLIARFNEVRTELQRRGIN